MTLGRFETNHIYNEDCLQAMKQIPDKYFELHAKNLVLIILALRLIKNISTC